MSELPGPRSFAGIPSPRSGRMIAREDTSARAVGLEALGAGLRSFGQDTLALAGQVAQKQQERESFRVQAELTDWQFEEARRFNEAIENMEPGQADGFAANYLSGYRERAVEFMRERVPERLLPQVYMPLHDQGQDGFAAALEFERGEQARFTLNRLEATLNNSLLPRLQTAAAMETIEAQQEALDEVIAHGIALINQATDLTEIQRDAIINGDGENVGFRERVQRDFAQRLIDTDPAQAADWLGLSATSTADRIMGAEGRGPDTQGTGSTAYSGFIERTWLDLMRRKHPEIEGTREEILAMRDDPALVREMTTALVEENSQGLLRNGIAATPGALYLAHFLGLDGAVAVLNADPTQAVDTVVAGRAIEMNPGVFQGNNIRTVGDLMAWADGKMGELPPYMPALLTAISFEARQAYGQDAETQIARNATARAAAETNWLAAAQNNLYVRLHDGTAGAADILQARQAGILTDIDDIEKAEQIYTEVNGDAIKAAEAIRLLVDQSYQFNYFNGDDKDAVDLAYDALGGVGEMLWTGAAAEDEDRAAQRDIDKARLRAVAERTGIIPTTALEALRGGMASPDMGTRRAAFLIMDELYRGALTTQAVTRALNEQEMGRLQTYQGLSPYYTPEALHERLNPTLDPREAAQVEALRAEGQTLAASIDNRMLLTYLGQKLNLGGAFGFAGPGAVNWQAIAPDVLQMGALRQDFENLFAERYAATYGNEELARTQAIERLTMKWGVTQTGEAQIERLMAYPPEQQFMPVAHSGAGGYQWMYDAIEDAVTREFPGTGVQDYWLVPTAETEGALLTGNPPYDLIIMDMDGMIHWRTVADLADDREAAVAEMRQQNGVDRDRAEQAAEAAAELLIERGPLYGPPLPAPPPRTHGPAQPAEQYGPPAPPWLERPLPGRRFETPDLPGFMRNMPSILAPLQIQRRSPV